MKKNSFNPNYKRTRRMEAARMLNISVRTLDTLTACGELDNADGTLTYFRDGNQVFYRWHELQEAYVQYVIRLAERRPNHPLIRKIKRSRYLG